MELTVEHVLMLALVFCAFYYLMGGCGCKEGAVFDTDGKRVSDKKCPQAGKTTACHADYQHCIYDEESCPDGKGCIANTKCRLCGPDDYGDCNIDVGYNLRQCQDQIDDYLLVDPQDPLLEGSLLQYLSMGAGKDLDPDHKEALRTMYKDAYHMITDVCGCEHCPSS